MKTEHLHALPGEWQATAAIFSALGDPHRQRILLLFEPKEALSIKTIASLFDLSRTAVVHHLNVLERAGVMRAERRGKETLYSVNPVAALEAVNALRGYILDTFPGCGAADGYEEGERS
jgi:Predicted transcriptional regulators